MFSHLFIAASKRHLPKITTLIFCACLFIIQTTYASSCGSFDSTKIEFDPIAANCTTVYEVGVDWSYCDLSYRTLSHLDLSNANLQGANLQGSDLSNTNLNRANLEGANLLGAKLNKTTFNYASAIGADFRAINADSSTNSSQNLDVEGACFSATPEDIGLYNTNNAAILDQVTNTSLTVQFIEQASTDEDAHASLALDGNKATYAHTSVASNGKTWIKLDLGANYFISGINWVSLDSEGGFIDKPFDINLSSWQDLSAGTPSLINVGASKSTINSVGRYIWLQSEEAITLNEIEVFGHLEAVTPNIPQPYEEGLIDYQEAEFLHRTWMQRKENYDANENLKKLDELSQNVNSVSNTLLLIDAVRIKLNKTCTLADKINAKLKYIPSIGPLRNAKKRLKDFVSPPLEQCKKQRNMFTKLFLPVYKAFSDIVTVVNIATPLLRNKVKREDQKLQIKLNVLTDAYFAVRNNPTAVNIENLTQASEELFKSNETIIALIEAFDRDLANQAQTGHNARLDMISASTLQTISQKIVLLNDIMAPIAWPLNQVSSVLGKRTCFTVWVPWPFDNWRICFSIASILDGLGNVPFINSFLSFADRFMDPILDKIFNALGLRLPSISFEIPLPSWLPSLPSFPEEVTNIDDLKQLADIDLWKTPIHLPAIEDADSDGLTNQAEQTVHYTSAYSEDSDADGIADEFEQTIPFLSPTNSIDATKDYDTDGLSNLDEHLNGTKLDIKDTDGDGLSDSWEVLHKAVPAGADPDVIQANVALNPLNPLDAQLDFDGDGLTNFEESQFNTSPFHMDQDEDGLNDLQERTLGTNPHSLDSDNDGIPDMLERDNGLNPLISADALSGATSDGVTNYEEYKLFNNLSVTRNDDSDELPDEWELLFFNELSALANEDNDLDNLTNLQEVTLGTHPISNNHISGELLGYKYSNSLTDNTINYNHHDISTSGTQLMFESLKRNNNIPIGFTFGYMDKLYSRLEVNLQGFVAFNEGKTYCKEHSDPCLSALYTENKTIDLARSKVFYQTIDIAPQQKLIVQYELYTENQPNIPVKFQIVLAEMNNSIRFNYQQTIDAELASSRGGTATIGVFDGFQHSILYSENEPSLAATAFTIEFLPLLAVFVDSPVGVAGQTTTHTVKITNNTETELNFPLIKAPGNLWPTRVAGNINVPQGTFAEFTVEVDVPNVFAFSNVLDPSPTDEAFITLTDNDVSLLVPLRTVNGSYDTSHYVDTYYFGKPLLDGNKVTVNWFVSQGLGFGWPETLSDAHIDRFNILETPETITGVNWLLNGSSLFFAIKPSLTYDLLAAGITSGFVDRPHYGLGFTNSINTNGIVIYYRNTNNELVPLPPQEWLFYREVSETMILMPLFENGSIQDLDGIENDRVLYSIVLGRLENPPTALPDTYDLTRGELLSVESSDGLLTNDINLAADNTINVLTQPNSGTLTVNQDGSFSYQHDGSLNTQDSFSYRLEDSRVYSDPVTIDLSILQPPSLTNVDATIQKTNEDTGLSFILNVLDDKPGLSWQVTESPLNGSIKVTSANNTAQLSYQPNTNFSGNDRITVMINDSEGNSEISTINITIDAINDPPTGVQNTYTLPPGELLSISQVDGLLTNDIDIDNATLQAQILTEPKHGTLILNTDGSFSYQHDGNYINNTDEFSYTAFDGENTSEPVKVVFSILINEQTARAFDDQYTVNEGELLTVNTTSGVRINDDLVVDVELIETPSYGTLLFNIDGSFSYQHDGGEELLDHFSYRLINSNSEQNVAQVAVSITPINDKPVIDAPDTLIYDLYGTTTPLTLELSATDAELSTLTWSVANTSTGIAIIEDIIEEVDDAIDAVKVNYQPEAGFIGQATFDVITSDAEEKTDQLSFTINIHADNGVPVANNDQITLNEGGYIDIDIHSTILANDSDPDSDEITLNLAKLPSNGALSTAPDNTLRYTHNGSENHADQFAYQANDGKEKSANATVNITIIPVNDAPYFQTAAPTAINENTFNYSYHITVDDVDSSQLNLSVLKGPDWLSLMPNGTNTWTLSGLPPVSLAHTYPVELALTDGQLTVIQRFQVNITNDIDNDGVNNLDDALPYDKTESIDTDGDGIGNNKDNDDDNDGIIDEQDSDPLNNDGDGKVLPTFTTIEGLIIEATGELTLVELTTPVVTAGSAKIVSITSSLASALPLGEHLISWTAIDFANNNITETQKVTVIDTTSPEFSDISPIKINAQGQLTDISPFVTSSAFDLVDGELSAYILGENKQTSGRHQMMLAASDNSGNLTEAEVIVDILPELAIAPKIALEAGGTYPITAYLDGVPPVYPVEFTYQLSLNGSVIEEELTTIEQGLETNLIINIPETVKATDSLALQLTNPNQAFIDINAKSQLSVISENLAPMISLVINQQGKDVNIVDPQSGLVTVQVDVADINQNDNHNITWSVDNNAFTYLVNDDDASSIVIDPSTLDEGIYTIDVIVTEEALNSTYAIHRRIQLIIETLPTLKDSDDTDNDGISDANEGYLDSDGDGIANVFDNDNNKNHLPNNNGTPPLKTSLWHSLSTGSVVNAIKGSQRKHANLTMAELTQFNIDSSGKPQSNAQDNGYKAITPIYNFVIDQLMPFERSAAIVIPLPINSVLPEEAIYRKYNKAQGWFTFIENEYNKIYSAMTDSNGNCPTPLDSTYELGLIAGNNCIQLIIEDGGANDADLTVNGAIEDPGVVSIQSLAPEIDLPVAFEANEESPLTLSATIKHEVDENNFTYLWQQESGQTVTLEDNTQPTLSFISPSVQQDEELTFSLTVSDGDKSSTETTIVTVYQVNKAPVIESVEQQKNYVSGNSATLSLMANDPDKDPLTYLWVQTSGSLLSIKNSQTKQIDITLPKVKTSEVINLSITVDDGVLSTTRTITFTLDPEGKSSGGAFGWGILLLILLTIRHKVLLREKSGRRILNF